MTRTNFENIVGLFLLFIKQKQKYNTRDVSVLLQKPKMCQILAIE